MALPREFEPHPCHHFFGGSVAAARFFLDAFPRTGKGFVLVGDGGQDRPVAASQQLMPERTLDFAPAGRSLACFAFCQASCRRRYVTKGKLW